MRPAGSALGAYRTQWIGQEHAVVACRGACAIRAGAGFRSWAARSVALTCPRCGARIGFVDSGGTTLDWLTAEDVVLTGIGSTLRPLWWTYSSEDRARARALLALLGCADLADREISTCSQGERGRIRIARALIADPPLLLLDEPAVGLDLAAREALIAALDRLSEEKPGLTSVLVTHHLEEIPASSTHAILLRDGQALAVGADRDHADQREPVGLLRSAGRVPPRWRALERSRPGQLVTRSAHSSLTPPRHTRPWSRRRRSSLPR